MRRVPRQAFVPPALEASAHDDRPLPIGHGQTISQPFIVALMTDMLRTAPGQTVLEIGTGSGYQAAILADLVATVHSIEIVTPLADEAERRLRQQRIRNVTVHRGDGECGVPSAAPFDGIMVTAAASVIPVGGAFALQHLVVVEKLPGGPIRHRDELRRAGPDGPRRGGVSACGARAAAHPVAAGCARRHHARCLRTGT